MTRFLVLVSLLASTMSIAIPAGAHGVDPGPQYRWVDPPEEAAAINQPPGVAALDIAFKGGESVRSYPATSDLQAALETPDGAMRLPPGATGARVTIDPLAAADHGEPPEGLTFTGNIYRVGAEFTPTGGTAPAFEADIVMLYPADASHAARGSRVLLTSVDGATWTRLPTGDGLAPHQVSGRGTVPAYLAVGAPRSGGWSTSIYAIAITCVGAGLVLAALLFRSRRRRSGQQGAT